jgi:hypothetical protein
MVSPSPLFPHHPHIKFWEEIILSNLYLNKTIIPSLLQ